jgi:hypothetical protein
MNYRAFDFETEHGLREAFRERMIREFTELPRKGNPAAELTDRDKLALAIAAGAPYTVVHGDRFSNTLTISTAVPVGVADRGDGGWLVAIGTKPAKAVPAPD